MGPLTPALQCMNSPRRPRKTRRKPGKSCNRLSAKSFSSGAFRVSALTPFDRSLGLGLRTTAPGASRAQRNVGPKNPNVIPYHINQHQRQHNQNYNRLPHDPLLCPQPQPSTALVHQHCDQKSHGGVKNHGKNAPFPRTGFLDDTGDCGKAGRIKHDENNDGEGL